MHGMPHAHTHPLMQAIARDDEVLDEGQHRRQTGGAASSSGGSDRPVGPRKDAVDFADETELVEDETPLASRGPGPTLWVLREGGVV